MPKRPNQICVAGRVGERLRNSWRYGWDLEKSLPDKGGQFAAFEQPDLFVDEVRAFFRLVR